MTEDYRYPKNWRPNWVKSHEKDGKKDYFYGQKGEKKHGHTVQIGSDIDYARTPEGRVMVDKKSAPQAPDKTADRKALMDKMRDKRATKKKQKGKGSGIEIGD